jgi:hypothetical protein
MRLILFIFLTLIVSVANAQSSKKKKKKMTSTETRSSSLEPYYPKSSQPYSKKSTKKKDASGATYDSEQEYYARIESLEKTRRKNEKLMEKPQYSDPLYFGHKHPPKKHAPGKMKFCKVCGIKH